MISSSGACAQRQSASQVLPVPAAVRLGLAPQPLVGWSRNTLPVRVQGMGDGWRRWRKAGGEKLQHPACRVVRALGSKLHRLLEVLRKAPCSQLVLLERCTQS